MKQKFSLQSQMFILILFIFAGLFLVTKILALLIIVLFVPDILNGPIDESSVALQLISAFCSQLGLFIMAYWVYLKAMGQSAKKIIRFDKPQAKWIALTVVSIVVILPLISLLSWVNVELISAFPSTGWLELMEQKEEMLLKLFAGNPAYFPAFLICFSFIPAVVEELIFRGLLFRKLLDVSSGNLHFAAWTSALIFGAIHFQPWALIPMIAMGGLFAYVYHRSKSIWYSVILHALNNASVLVVYTYFPELNL